MRTERNLTKKTDLFLSDAPEALSRARLETLANEWLLECGFSCRASTVANRRLYVSKLLWFLDKKKLTVCDVSALRAFFHYLTHGYKEPGGRWGNPHETEPVKPSTLATYRRHLFALFRWIQQEKGLTENPIERIKLPPDRNDQIEPFTEEQVNALLHAASKSRHPKRDTALLLFLLDTGIRSSELCALNWQDVDTSARSAKILEGKGGKSRTVYFNKDAAKALWDYVKIDRRDPTDPLFVSERGERLTRSGVQQMLKRLEATAGVKGVRVSPHTMRHTFAVMFLRAGGQQLALMRLQEELDSIGFPELMDAEDRRPHALELLSSPAAKRYAIALRECANACREMERERGESPSDGMTEYHELMADAAEMEVFGPKELR